MKVRMYTRIFKKSISLDLNLRAMLFLCLVLGSSTYTETSLIIVRWILYQESGVGGDIRMDEFDLANLPYHHNETQGMFLSLTLHTHLCRKLNIHGAWKINMIHFLSFSLEFLSFTLDWQFTCFCKYSQDITFMNRKQGRNRNGKIQQETTKRREQSVCYIVTLNWEFLNVYKF